MSQGHALAPACRPPDVPTFHRCRNCRHIPAQLSIRCRPLPPTVSAGGGARRVTTLGSAPFESSSSWARPGQSLCAIGVHHGRMRREVARAAMTAAWIALAVLAVPLAVSVYLLVLGDERGELERAGLRAATRVDPSFVAGDPAELPSVGHEIQLGLYDASGRLRAGSGPPLADETTRAALRGVVAQGRSGGSLLAAVPTASGERVTGVIRAASPTAAVWRRTVMAWAAMAALVTAALLAALGTARRRARRLAVPLETLANASRAVGDGDFSARVQPCGIEEIDRVAETQNVTVGRLGELLERERQFTANASHQLRTPLAGLQLVLEAAYADPARDPHAALEEALSTTRRLQATVEDVLALHRDDSIHASRGWPSGGGAFHGAGEEPRPLGRLLDEVASRWHGPLAAAGRRLGHTCDNDVAATPLPSIRAGQILDVLLDNALRHGAGLVRIRARSAGSAIGIDVCDEGPGIPEEAGDVFKRGSGAGHGIGLSLARDFAASLGGRLVLSSRTPPVFTLLLPATPASDGAAMRSTQ